MNGLQRGACASGLLAGSALAQSGGWLADLADTGDGDGLIEPGERARITLLVDMTPDVGTIFAPDMVLHHFASANPRLANIEHLDSGSAAVVWLNPLAAATPGFASKRTPDGGFRFTDPFINIGQFVDVSDPIPLFTWEWTPTTYEARRVLYRVESLGVDNLYGQERMLAGFNYWINEVLAEWPLPSAEFSLRVVPAPHVLAPALAPLALGMRRARR